MGNKHLVWLASLSLMMLSSLGFQVYAGTSGVHKSGEATLPAYPGATLVDEFEDASLINRMIVTGEVKRVRTEYRPESSINLEGSVLSRTYKLAAKRQTKRAVEFYQAELEAGAGKILFSCQGRDCGSSNYWANSFFKKALLYGPERHQFYGVSRTEQGAYQMVYVAERGTGAVYVHIVRITPDQNSVNVAADDEVSSLEAQLRMTGRYAFQNPIGAEAFASLVTYLSERSELRFALVVHNTRSAGESLDGAVTRSESTAQSLKLKFAAEGIDEIQIGIYGIGPLAPAANGQHNRAVLIQQ